MRALAKNPLAIVLCGGVIMGLALGIRHIQGLYMLPMTASRGWTREDVAFAFALQNLVWGLAQPFTGMIADRFGSARVLLAGCLVYALGLYLTMQAGTPLQLALGAGVVTGMALSATTFGIVYGALSRIVAPARRGWALGVAGAAGGLGQFAMVPFGQTLIAGYGWMTSLMLIAMLMTAVAPSGLMVDDRGTTESGARAQSIMEAIREAFSHRGFWLLNLGFLACGFQLAFIAGHLPAYLADKGMNGQSAVIALSLIALANTAGTYWCGVLGATYRRKHLLAYIYVLRSAAIALFVALPVSAVTLYAFSIAMGLLWLGTAPLTNGLVSQVFGLRYLSMLFGFVFVGHQVGGFFGAWLGGRVFDATGSYNPIWLASIMLGLIAAALHWPIDDRAVARLRPA